MKMKLFRFLACKNWIYRLSVKMIANRIIWGNNLLTPKYLLDHGWVENDGYYTQPDIKGRNLITIQFEHHYYRIWHSDKKTFIALASSIEWFEMYYLMVFDDNARFELAGV